MTRDTNLTNLINNIQIVTHLATEHFNLASIMSVSTNSSREHYYEKSDSTEYVLPLTLTIYCTKDTSKVSNILLKIIEGPILSIITLMHFVQNVF